MDHGLDVGAGAELMAPGLELAPQIEVVVELAVEHDPDTTVFVRHRLRAALEVHDAEPTVPEGGVPAPQHPDSAPIRPPMSERLGEPLYERADVAALISGDHTGDAAHLPSLPHDTIVPTASAACRAAATRSCCASVRWGNIGSESARAATRSLAGKLPLARPRPA